MYVGLVKINSTILNSELKFQVLL